LSLIRVEFEAARTGKLRSVLHFNGLPIDARSITDEILAQEGRLKDVDAGALASAARG
jgi:2-oxoglutarate/2-oxoacid ferredoxin oxidoreductase subunit alpha